MAKNLVSRQELRPRAGVLRTSVRHAHAVTEQGVTARRRDALNSPFCIELAGAAADRGDAARDLCFVPIRGRPVMPVRDPKQLLTNVRRSDALLVRGRGQQWVGDRMTSRPATRLP